MLCAELGVLCLSGHPTDLLDRHLKVGRAREADAVVDPQLRVHGIAALRVADASIMPAIVAGNTNAPAIMIGEQCAAMVLDDAMAA